jgi:hypothetical protein
VPGNISINGMRFWILFSVLGFSASVFGESGEAGVPWMFEGLLETVGNELVPRLQTGWVLSGTFLIEPEKMEALRLDGDGTYNRQEGGLSGLELTVDLYYQAEFSAVQSEGPSGYDWQPHNDESEASEGMGWYFPIRGSLAATAWEARWIQFWLFDSSAELFHELPLESAETALSWESGWFRIAFAGGNGADWQWVEGPITVFAPLADVESRDPVAELEGIVRHLGTQLRERDGLLRELERSLESAHGRIAAMETMVDALIRERTHLREEVEQLQAERMTAPAPGDDPLPALEAELVLARQRQAALEERATELADALATAGIERQKLEAELEAAQAVASEFAAMSGGSLEKSDFILEPGPTVIERPVIVHEIVYRDREADLEPGTVPASSDEPTERSKRKPRGPRKFR